MNCDTAFDLMTDPHGSRSGALAEHFGTCPRCRRMQETLAPALEFLADDPALSWANRESTHSAAGGQPIVTAEAVQLARQAATNLASRAELPRVRVLAQSCAVCHQTSLPESNDHSAIRPVRSAGSWDWLIPILEAQPQSLVDTPEFGAGQMIATTIECPQVFSNHG